MKYTSKIMGAAALATLLLPTITLAHPLNLSTNTNFKVATAVDEIKTKVAAKIERKQEKMFSGTVTAQNGSLLTMTAKNGTVYTVDATNAKFVHKFNGAMSLGEIQINDTIFVNGTIEGSKITAKLIRDESLQARNATFNGKVTAVNGMSFTLESRERGNQTVNTTSSTTIKKNDAAGTLGDITVGATVRVSGVWNSTNKNITAKTVVVVVRLHPETITGTVVAKTDTTLSIKKENNKTFTVSTSKAFVFGKEWSTLTLNDIAVNDKISAYGIQLNDDLALTGIWIRDLSK